MTYLVHAPAPQNVTSYARCTRVETSLSSRRTRGGQGLAGQVNDKNLDVGGSRGRVDRSFGGWLALLCLYGMSCLTSHLPFCRQFSVFFFHLNAKVSYALPAETVAGLVGVVPALEKARLYRGRGGELMRQAACRVVECLALTRSDVAVKTQVIILSEFRCAVGCQRERFVRDCVGGGGGARGSRFAAARFGVSWSLKRLV